jgi:hypothetical protein
MFVIGLIAVWALQIGACLVVVVAALLTGKLRLRSFPARVAFHEPLAPTATRSSDLGASAVGQAHNEERLPGDEQPTERRHAQREDADHVTAR